MNTGNMHRNLVKFGHVVFELCEQTDRQTDIQANRQTDCNTSLRYRGRSDHRIRHLIYTCTMESILSGNHTSEVNIYYNVIRDMKKTFRGRLKIADLNMWQSEKNTVWKMANMKRRLSPNGISIVFAVFACSHFYQPLKCFTMFLRATAYML